MSDSERTWPLIKLTMVRMDDLVEYGPCPTCGASVDQQCHYLDAEGAAVEVSTYVHSDREGAE